MSKRILIIDDDVDLSSAMKAILEAEHFTVSVASTGSDGIKQARSAPPDLLILDIMMERVDTGFKVLEKLKEDPITSSFPVLILSSVIEKTSAPTFPVSDMGWFPAEEFLEKPCLPETLIVTVKRLLSK